MLLPLQQLKEAVFVVVFPQLKKLALVAVAAAVAMLLVKQGPLLQLEPRPSSPTANSWDHAVTSTALSCPGSAAKTCWEVSHQEAAGW